MRAHSGRYQDRQPVSLSLQQPGSTAGQVRQLNRRLSPKGLCLLPLCFTQGSALLYLYRPATLRRDLSDELAWHAGGGGV